MRRASSILDLKHIIRASNRPQHFSTISNVICSFSSALRTRLPIQANLRGIRQHERGLPALICFIAALKLGRCDMYLYAQVLTVFKARAYVRVCAFVRVRVCMFAILRVCARASCTCAAGEQIQCVVLRALVCVYVCKSGWMSADDTCRVQKGRKVGGRKRVKLRIHNHFALMWLIRVQRQVIFPPAVNIMSANEGYEVVH